jgi:hypothetical protein
MAFTVPVENYVRSPYPSLPESKERYLQEELKKLERTLGTVSGALNDLDTLRTAPVFSAYQSVAQSFPISTDTKVLFDSEEFDTAGAYDTATSVFQPAVPGYYRITAGVGFTASASLLIMLYKNGTEHKRGVQSGSSLLEATGSWLVHLNGTTDYLEVYARQGSPSAMNAVATAAQTYFQGSLERVA